MGQGLQRLQCIRYENEACVIDWYVLAFVHDSGDAAGVDGLLSICIAVEIIAFQGEKELAYSRSARVRGDTGGRIEMRLDGLELRI
jgi:hypothetical protein